MSIYALCAQDIWTLSTIAGFDLSVESPLAILDERIEEFSSEEAFKKSVDRLIESGYLLLRKDNNNMEVRLDLLPLFKVMMEPEEIVSFYFGKPVDIRNFYFLRRSNTWVHYAMSTDFEIHTFCRHPEKEMMSEWIRDQLEVRITETILPENEMEFSFSPSELVLMMAMQEIMRQRVEAMSVENTEPNTIIEKNNIKEFLSEGDITNFFFFFHLPGNHRICGPLP